MRYWFSGDAEVIEYGDFGDVHQECKDGCAQERSGNFSDFPEPIYDPTTGLPFPGNMIPSPRIGATATFLNKLYPQPTNSNLVDNYTGTTPGYNKQTKKFDGSFFGQ